MNQGKDHLFQLIQSMSSSEKRYFKRNALIAKDADANYLKLFDALNKMQEYDEAALKKKPFVKHFASERKYLYEAILRSLRNYCKEESIRTQIFDLLIDADNLYKRSLYDQSEKRLKKAERLAEEIGDLIIVLEIINLRRRFIRQNKSRNYGEEMEEQITTKNNVLKDIQDEMNCADLSDRIFARIIKNHSIKSEKEKEELMESYLSSLQKMDYEQLSPTGKRYFDQCHVMLFRITEDFDKMEIFQERMMNWWKENSVFRDQNFALYINIVNNYITLLIRLNKSHLVPEVLAEFDQLKISNYHDKRAAFEKVANWKLLYYFDQRDISPIRSLIPKYEADIKRFQLSDFSAISLQGNFIIFYFLMSEWENCQTRINDFLTSRRHQVREGVTQFVRLLSLAVYHELGDTDKLETSLRSAQRYFEKTIPDKNRYEYEVLKYFRILLKATEVETKILFQDFHDFLKHTMDSSATGRFLPAVEEMGLWVESHLEQTSILEIFQRGKNHP